MDYVRILEVQAENSFLQCYCYAEMLLSPKSWQAPTLINPHSSVTVLQSRYIQYCTFSKTDVVLESNARTKIIYDCQ